MFEKLEFAFAEVRIPEVYIFITRPQESGI